MTTHHASHHAPSPSADGGAPTDHAAELAFIAAAIRHERDALDRVAARVGPAYARALDLIEACSASGGTVLVTGLGKSGLIGAKIAATLASLGTPAHAVHPTEAVHGDLGRFRPADLVLCLTHSGETAEVVDLAAILRQDGLPIIAITRETGDGAPSAIQRVATVVLEVPVSDEAGGAGMLAPTSSTTAALAIGDALALAAARRRRFTADEFAKRHPGGMLGGMLRPVTQLLRIRAGVNCPLAREADRLVDVLRHAESLGRRPGAVLITDDDGRLTGILTDADIRRLILHAHPDAGRALEQRIGDVMTRAPRALPDTALASDAAAMVRTFRQDEVPVVDGDGRPVGLLDVQDLIAMKLVDDTPAGGPPPRRTEATP